MAEAKTSLPPMFNMISEAVQETAVPRKGASIQAIKSWITNKYGVEVKPGIFKKALEKGLENGTFERPKGSESHGATGSILLSKKKPEAKKESKPVPKVAEAEKPDKPKAAKSLKPALSDSDLLNKGRKGSTKTKADPKLATMNETEDEPTAKKAKVTKPETKENKPKKETKAKAPGKAAKPNVKTAAAAAKAKK